MSFFLNGKERSGGLSIKKVESMQIVWWYMVCIKPPASIHFPLFANATRNEIEIASNTELYWHLLTTEK